MDFGAPGASRYKVTFDADESRRRRGDSLVEIRNNKREESLRKKRRTGLQAQQVPAAVISSSNTEKMLESLPAMVAGVLSDDLNLQLEATTQFRKLLSIERSPPIEEVIQAGVVPRFVEFLARGDFPQLQFEAVWTLTNIASGTSENTKAVIGHGAVPIFVTLLSSPSDDVREQAALALGNLSGDSPQCRHLVLRHEALIPLLRLVDEPTNLSMLRSATWTLSNFCRGKPPPSLEQVLPALRSLEYLVYSDDEEVLTNACWAYCYLSDGTGDKFLPFTMNGFCPQLMKLLCHPSPSVLVPALRTVGNFVTGNDVQTQDIIDAGALSSLVSLLTSNHKESIKKEACWSISNITAGTEEQIQAVIDAGLVCPLMNLFQNTDFDIKKEAAWAVSNATSGGNHEQIMFFVNPGCVNALCDLLTCTDRRIVIVCLEGIMNILRAWKLGNNNDVSSLVTMIDNAKGVKEIEKLQGHVNSEVYERARKILKTLSHF